MSVTVALLDERLRRRSRDLLRRWSTMSMTVALLCEWWRSERLRLRSWCTATVAMTMLLLRGRSSHRWLRHELRPAVRLLDLRRRGNVLVTATPSMESFAPTLGGAMLDCNRLFERPHSARRSDVTMTTLPSMPALASARRGNARRRGRDEARNRWSHLMASAVLRRSHRSRETGRRSVRHSRRFSL